MSILYPQHPQSYPRTELEEMVERWLDANRRAESTGDWKSTLGAHYTDDAEYRWDVGPEETFVARGVQEIRDVAIGYQMAGFDGWSYPYDRVLIDDQKGEVVGFWRQVAPVKRADGSAIEVPGVGGSWFRYGGDWKWSHQQDFFDFSSVMATMRELAALGALPESVKKKIQMVTRGKPLPGHEANPHVPSPMGKLRGNLALARIALIGR